MDRQRRVVLTKYQGMCGYCLLHQADGVHEIIPRSAGGGCIEENQIPLCTACHDTIQADWRMYVLDLYAAQDRARSLLNPQIVVGKEVP